MKSDKCDACTPANATTCTTEVAKATACKVGFYVASDACVACAADTLTCSSSAALTCAKNTVLDTTCKKCTGTDGAACAKADVAVPTGCVVGKALDSNKCDTTSCDAGIKRCAAKDKALECASGYTFTAADDTKCEACTATNAKECAYGKAIPSECKSGFDFFNNGTDDVCCKGSLNCKTCDATKCLTCVDATNYEVGSAGSCVIKASYKCTGSNCYVSCKAS